MIDHCHGTRFYFKLIPFASDTGGIESVEAELRTRPSSWLLRYEVTGNLARLVVPAERGPDPLWSRTCFELFMRSPETPWYWEWNFCPSGAWDLYALRATRQHEKPFHPGNGGVEGVHWQRVDERTACLYVKLSPPPSPLAETLWYAPEKLHLSPTVILKSSSGTNSYWALKHPADKPDFHRADLYAESLSLFRRA